MQATTAPARLHPFILFVRVSCVVLTILLLALGGFWIYGVPRLQATTATGGGAVACVGTCANAEGAQAELGAGLQQGAAAPVTRPRDVSNDPIGHLVIPAMGIDAVVYPVGTAQDGSMDVTQNAWTVGWWKPGIRPGNPGDSVMTCHNHWYTGNGDALCKNLNSIATGAEVDVKLTDGTTRRFTVDDVQTVPWNTQVNGLFDTHGPARLSIVTCGGTWDTKTQNYSLRVIVNTHLASASA